MKKSQKKNNFVTKRKKMEGLSIEQQLLTKMSKAGEGKLFFSKDFYGLGSSTGIRKALQRLVESQQLVRVAQGAYTIPETDPLFGKVMPGIEAYAYAIAKRDRARIAPTGIAALNSLGLSTQVPLNVVYLTDGAPRKVKFGNQSIKFKKATPKNLMAKGRVSSLVIQALRALGKAALTEKELGKIHELLKKERPENIIHDMQLAPAWISEIMRKALSYTNESMAPLK